MKRRPIAAAPATSLAVRVAVPSTDPSPRGCRQSRPPTRFRRRLVSGAHAFAAAAWPESTQPPPPLAVSDQICAEAVARIGADAATAHGLPNPCGYRLLGPASDAPCWICAAAAHAQRKRSVARASEGESACQMQKKAGSDWCGWQTLASVHPLFYTHASTVLAPLGWAQRPAWPRPRLATW